MKTFIIIAALLLLAGCSQAGSEKAIDSLTVYKTPSCGCCNDWLNHLSTSGIPFTSENRPSLAQLKSELGIAPNVRSCHTGVSTEGYVFEGHVPAKWIQAFLAQPPEGALGLSVPGMPLGSPGMEVPDAHGGSKFMPYQVLLLMKDGTSKPFADVPTYDSQF